MPGPAGDQWRHGGFAYFHQDSSKDYFFCVGQSSGGSEDGPAGHFSLQGNNDTGRIEKIAEKVPLLTVSWCWSAARRTVMLLQFTVPYLM